MLRSISVETGLDDIKAHLHACGYEVVDMDACIRPVEAIVYTGATMQVQVNEVAKGAGRLAENTVMINAAGMTAEQVSAQIEERIGGIEL